MSLPEVGEVVTVLFNGDATGTISGALYGVVGKIVDRGVTPEPYVALWMATVRREANYVVRAEFEGIYWARGAGSEVEAALIASFTLWSGR